MRFTVIAGHELDASHRARWLELRRGDPRLASPYFCPELTVAVASVRDDVRITVLEEGGRVVGFFPFQRGRLGAGGPAGGPLSDYQGVIAAADAAWDPTELLAGSGLALWAFDHLLAAQAPFAPHHRALASSPRLDLSRGFEAWRRGRLDAGSGRIAQLERKRRKLEREVGPVRFEARTLDPRVLARVMAWKSAQCQRTGVPDVFAPRWTRALLDRVLAADEPHFAGTLSALHAGDHLVAAHLGLRSDQVWHWWFPVYDAAFARHSPGALLLLETAREAAAAGLVALDLGKGDDDYKASFADDEVLLAEGCVTRPSLGASVRRLREEGERLARASRLLLPLRPALRRVRAWMRRRELA